MSWIRDLIYSLSAQSKPIHISRLRSACRDEVETRMALKLCRELGVDVHGMTYSDSQATMPDMPLRDGKRRGGRAQGT